MNNLNTEIQKLIRRTERKNYRNNNVLDSNYLHLIDVEIDGKYYTLSNSGTTEACTTLEPTAKKKRTPVNIDKETQRKIILAMGWRL